MTDTGYQLAPTVNDLAFWLAPGAANPAVKAALSISSSVYRATTCRAPQFPAAGSKFLLTRTPRSPAASPVNRYEPVTSHAWLDMSLVRPLFATSCVERIYSAKAPKDL